MPKNILSSTTNGFLFCHIIYDRPTCILSFCQRLTLYYTVRLLYYYFFPQMAFSRVLLVVPLFATSILSLYFLIQNAPPTDNQVRSPLLTNYSYNNIGTYQLWNAKQMKTGLLPYFLYPFALGWLN